MNSHDSSKTSDVAASRDTAAMTPGRGRSAASVRVSDQLDYPGVTGKLTVNRERAHAVMEASGIDGLIATSPINVQYLANSVPILTKMRADDPAFATYPRDPGQTPFFITSTGNAMETANGDREVPEIMPFSSPATAGTSFLQDLMERPSFEPPALARRFAVSDEAGFTPRERAWLAAQDIYNPHAAPTALWALVRALKASGLDRGTVALDDLRYAQTLRDMGLADVTFVPGNNVFRRIRMIKSAPEIALMRAAQTNNVAAALAAVRSLEEGMTYRAFERRFQAECAARGSLARFVLLGFSQALLPDDEIKRGKSYMLDAVSEYRGYHGDFGRTVVVGEPSAMARARSKAQQIGRAEGFANIRAGVAFRDVEAAARRAMIKAGMPEHACSTITLHSVGLQHVDHPSFLEPPFDPQQDLILRENMTVTLDLPYLEIGSGGGHNEDMLLVTKSGFEVLNDESEPLVMV